MLTNLSGERDQIRHIFFFYIISATTKVLPETMIKSSGFELSFAAFKALVTEVWDENLILQDLTKLDNSFKGRARSIKGEHK